MAGEEKDSAFVAGGGGWGGTHITDGLCEGRWAFVSGSHCLLNRCSEGSLCILEHPMCQALFRALGEPKEKGWIGGRDGGGADTQQSITK